MAFKNRYLNTLWTKIHEKTGRWGRCAVSDTVWLFFYTSGNLTINKGPIHIIDYKSEELDQIVGSVLISKSEMNKIYLKAALRSYVTTKHRTKSGKTKKNKTSRIRSIR